MTGALKKPLPIHSVAPAATGYAVLRNEVMLKTPVGADIVVPTAALAEAIVSEWRAQGDKIVHATMPMMQLAATTLDIVVKDREAIIDQVAAYAASDLICHWAEHPADLVKLQRETWQPVLDWCAGRFGAALKTGVGIMPITQVPEALVALKRAVASYDTFRLTGLRQAADVTGSLVLGLALVEGHLSVEQAFDAAELDTSFQTQNWGEDPEIAKRREDVRCDLAVCRDWFQKLS